MSQVSNIRTVRLLCVFFLLDVFRFWPNLLHIFGTFLLLRTSSLCYIYKLEHSNCNIGENIFGALVWIRNLGSVYYHVTGQLVLYAFIQNNFNASHRKQF